MSIRNHMINGSYGVYENLDVNNILNVDGTIIYQGNPLNPNPSGGSTSITNTDKSVSVALTNGSYVLSNAGSSLAGDMNCNTHNINNVNSLVFENEGEPAISVYYNDGFLAYNQTGNNTGNVFDTNYNFPYISTVLAKNSNCNNNSMTGLASVSTSTLNCPALTNVSTINGVSYPPASASGTSSYIYMFDSYSLLTNPINVSLASPNLYFSFPPIPVQPCKYFKLNIANLTFTLSVVDNTGASQPQNFLNYNLYLGNSNGYQYVGKYGNEITNQTTPNNSNATEALVNQSLTYISPTATQNLYLCFLVNSPLSCSVNITSINLEGVLECYESLQIMT